MPDEYISREAMLEHLDRCKQSEDATTLTAAVITALQCFVQSQPTADVAEVVQAKWILDRYPNLPARECSQCKIMIPRMRQVPDQFWQYCPNCGAKMDGAAE